MPNSVVEDVTSWQDDATGSDTNLPDANSSAGTGQSQDLAGNLRLLKSEMRSAAIRKGWERWKGLKNLAASANITFTHVNGTTFTVNDDFTHANRTVAVVKRRVRAKISTGFVYGTISSASYSAPNTTIVAVWDSGSIDATLSEVEFGLELRSLPKITDAEIDAAAAIAQSKISGLVAALAALLLKAGDTMTGDLVIRKTDPALRLDGDSADWRMTSGANGELYFQENTGSEGTPTWTTRYTLANGAGGPAAATDLVTKAYSDDIPFLNAYTSSGQTIITAGALSLAHGLGATPKLVQVRLVCTVVGGEAGYAQGEEIIIQDTQNSANANQARGVVLSLDATNINVKYANQSNVFEVINKSTGNREGLTNASWQMVVRAWV